MGKGARSSFIFSFPMDSRAARAVRNTDAETDADNEVYSCRLSTPEDTPVKITTDSRAESGHTDKQVSEMKIDLLVDAIASTEFSAASRCQPPLMALRGRPATRV